MSRFLHALITIVGVVLLVFLTLRIVPGDPVELMLGETSSAVDRDKLRSQLELDLPLAAQLSRFVSRTARGDLGESIIDRKPVRQLIAERAPYTVGLAFAILGFGLLFGVPAGVLSAHFRQRPLGQAGYFGALAVASIPVFWLAPLLIMALGLRWPWLPVSGYVNSSSAVLPTIAAGVGLAAYLMLTTRAAVLECLGSDYIRTAIAKGATPKRVLFFHAFPNAAVPVATAALLQLGHLLTGAVIIETIFDWPGLGKLAMDSILARDYPVIQGVAIFIAVVYVVLNTATDLANRRLSPERDA